MSCITGSMSRHLGRLFALALFGLVAACAIVPRPNPPEVEGAVVSLDRVENTNAIFRIVLDLSNPNPQPLTVQGLDVLMTVEGERVAGASLTAPLTLPASGRGTAQLEARTSMDGFMRALGAAMLRGAFINNQTLRWAISGTLTLGGGWQIPISRSGELADPGRRA